MNSVQGIQKTVPVNGRIAGEARKRLRVNLPIAKFAESKSVLKDVAKVDLVMQKLSLRASFFIKFVRKFDPESCSKVEFTSWMFAP